MSVAALTFLVLSVRFIFDLLVIKFVFSEEKNKSLIKKR
jgi:hypothetical protein